MEDLTIVTCNYNTPDLIRNLLLSITKTCEDIPDVLIVSTGDQKFEDKPKKLLWSEHFILQTPHGVAVNKAFELVKTRYILLVDSDVLFLKDISKPFEKFKEGGFTLMGDVVGDRGGKSLYPRVNPWFCFMDLESLKKHSISFYDHHRTKELKSERIYDIGSTMFEDVINSNLSVADTKMEGKYFKHYEGMSWRVQKYNPNDIDTDIDIGGTHNNQALYEYGLLVQKQYEQDIKNLQYV
jgi:hypothetical protein